MWSKAGRVGDSLPRAWTLRFPPYSATRPPTCIPTDMHVTASLFVPRSASPPDNAAGGRTNDFAVPQVHNQLGETPPDVEDFKPLVAAFKATQALLDT